MRDLKRLQKKEGKPLGRIVSDLIAQALAAQPKASAHHLLPWISRDMAARVDLTDKEALRAALDAEEPDR